LGWTSDIQMATFLDIEQPRSKEPSYLGWETSSSWVVIFYRYDGDLLQKGPKGKGFVIV
jgi:hypothetical protein